MYKIKVVGQQPSALALRDSVVDFDSTQPVTICWGARPHVEEGTLVLNGVPAVDALSQFQKMIEAGISVPNGTTSVIMAMEWERRGIKTFGRRLYHTRGNDIIGAGYRPPTRRRPERFNTAWLNRNFWVQVIPSTDIANEWRIHVFQGRVIARGLKIKTGPQIRVQPVRNRANGWTLTHDVDPPTVVKEAARRAVAAVGYNFGAVDVFELNDGRACVLEVNSAPALLSTYTMDAYLKAISKIAEGKYRKIYTGPTEGV